MVEHTTDDGGSQRERSDDETTEACQLAAITQHPGQTAATDPAPFTIA